MEILRDILGLSSDLWFWINEASGLEFAARWIGSAVGVYCGTRFTYLGVKKLVTYLLWDFGIFPGILSRHPMDPKREDDRPPEDPKQRARDLALTCRGCGELASPISGTENRYRCAACGNQFAGAAHRI